jgi:peptide/nickel transport system substrate-binding protein
MVPKRMTRRAFVKAVGGGVASLGILTGLGRHAGGQTESICRHVTDISDVPPYDPHMSTSGDAKHLAAMMCNGLVRNPPYNPTIDPKYMEPDLAEKWVANTARTEWTFTLRKGVQFHRGYGEFTAEDVKFSIEDVQNPKTGSPFAPAMKGWKVEVLQKYEVKIILPQPEPFFLPKLFPYQQGNITSKKAYEDLGDRVRTRPVGTGPFEFEDYRPGEKLVLKAHKNYWRGKPLIDRYEYLFSGSPVAKRNALLSGHAHLGRIVGDYSAVQDEAKRAGLVFETFGLPKLVNVFLNTEIKPFDDIRVRRAVQHAVDPKEAAGVFSEGTGVAEAIHAPWPAPTAFGGLDLKERWYPYDPAKARELLKQAGYPNGFDAGIAILIDTPEFMRPMEVYSAQLAKVGIKMRPEGRSDPNYFESVRGGRVALSLYMCQRLPDAIVYIAEFMHSRNIGFNALSRVRNKEIDTKIERAEKEVDAGKRAEQDKQLQEWVMDQALVIPTYVQKQVGVRSARLKLGYPPFLGTWLDNYMLTEQAQLA